MKKQRTTINEAARKALGITRDEYALLSYAMYRAGDPRGKKDGWCSDPKDEIADFVGISRQGLYKMIARLCDEQLLESDSKSGFIRATGKFIDSDNSCKLSLHDTVNKVDTTRKLSLQSSVNKVDTECKLSLHDTLYKYNKENIEGEIEGENAPAPGVELTSTSEQKEKINPPIAPAPLNKKESSDHALTYDQRPCPRDADELKERMRAYFTANANEWHHKVIKNSKTDFWTAEKFDSAVTSFCLHMQKTSDLRRTYNEYVAALTTWFIRQKEYDARDSAKPNASKQSDQNTTFIPTNIPVFR